MSYKGIATAFAVLIVSSVAAAAQVLGPAWPEEMGAFSVRLDDNASGGCWTNLGEVRRYAEDQLAERGFTVFAPTSKDPSNWKLTIDVIADRDGGCNGAVIVEISTLALVAANDGVERLQKVVFWEETSTYWGWDNLNRQILDDVRTFFSSIDRVNAMNAGNR